MHVYLARMADSGALAIAALKPASCWVSTCGRAQSCLPGPAHQTCGALHCCHGVVCPLLACDLPSDFGFSCAGVQGVARSAGPRLASRHCRRRRDDRHRQSHRCNCRIGSCSAGLTPPMAGLFTSDAKQQLILQLILRLRRVAAVPCSKMKVQAVRFNDMECVLAVDISAVTADMNRGQGGVLTVS